MFNVLVKKRNEAFAKGKELINILSNETLKYNYSFDTFGNQDKYLGASVIDITNFIYTNNNFYEYVKYSLIGKKYDRIIKIFLYIILALFILIIKLVFDYFGRYIAIIVGAVEIFIYVLLILKANTSNNYKKYYYNTFLNFILNPFDSDSKYSLNSISLSDDDIKNNIALKFTSKSFINGIFANIKNDRAKLTDILLKNKREISNSDGTKVIKNETVLNGLYLKIDFADSYNVLKGNHLRIIEDENLLSYLAEDTAKGIYESNLEYNFNSEEMNKAFDCKMSGYAGFIDKEDALHTVAKIITPSFEEHLLYLKGRYNAFNMDITDKYITFWVNMDRGLFQKLKYGEILDFKTSYREKYTLVGVPEVSGFGYEEFTYYKVFPFMEKMYLIRYLYYLYSTYMNVDNYYNINSDIIKSFEIRMQEIYNMDIREFRKMYLEEIKSCKSKI